MANFSSKWYSSPDPVLVAFLESQKRTESNELVAEASLGSHFGFPGCGKLPCYPSGRRVRAGLYEFSGALASKQLILLYPDRDTVFYSLNIIRFQGASEFLDQGMTSVSNRARIFFGHS